MNYRVSKFQYVQYYFWIKILDIPDSYGFLYGLDCKGNIESVVEHCMMNLKMFSLY